MTAFLGQNIAEKSAACMMTPTCVCHSSNDLYVGEKGKLNMHFVPEYHVSSQNTCL